MEPVPTQTVYTDSALTPPKKNLKPLIIKIGGGVLLFIIILGLAAYFVWPLPQVKEAQKLRDIEAALNSNDLNSALAKLDEQLAKDPQNEAFLTAKALVVAQKGSLEFKEAEFGAEAVAIAGQAVAANPKSSEAYRALAYGYEIQQMYKEAHENYAKALELNPKNSHALYGNAHCYDLEGDMTKAEEGYRLAVSFDPTLDQAHVGLSRVFASKGDLDGAIGELKQAFELATNKHNKAESAYSLARLSVLKKDMQLATYYSRQSVLLDPQYALGWYIEGTIMFADAFNTTKYPNAADRGALMKRSIATLQHAVTLNPNQTLAHFQLAVELSAVGSRVQGQRAYAKALEVLDKDITLSAADKVSVREQITQSQALAAKVDVAKAAKTPKN